VRRQLTNILFRDHRQGPWRRRARGGNRAILHVPGKPERRGGVGSSVPRVPEPVREDQRDRPPLALLPRAAQRTTAAWAGIVITTRAVREWRTQT
jgi:hypothetical protein